MSTEAQTNGRTPLGERLPGKSGSFSMTTSVTPYKMKRGENGDAGSPDEPEGALRWSDDTRDPQQQVYV